VSNSILTCERFAVDLGKQVYKGEEFTIAPGQIAHIFALSEFRAQDFLYLIAGLQHSRGLTLPATTNSLRRTDLEVTAEKLDFILLRDKPIYSYTPLERARLVGMVYENPEVAIIGNMVIEDFWYSFAAIDSFDRHLPAAVLQRYGLYEKLNRPTDVLSGGERHRLNCACALELEPNLLIGDFSASNLDKDFLKDFLLWIKEFINRGNAVLLTGLSVDELRIFGEYTPLRVQNETIEIGDHDPEFFKSRAEENKILKAYLKDRRKDGQPLVKVNNLHIPGRTQPISFDIAENEILIVEGPNGCGKTTLGHILAGRIHRRNYVGDFEFEEKINPALCLQHPERSFVWLTVERELPHKDLLKICGISEEQWQAHPRKLSRAQQKLLSVAVTLSNSSRFAILDEPTCGMDFPAKLKFVELLNYFRDMTILIFTHDAALDNFCRTIRYQEEVR